VIPCVEELSLGYGVGTDLVAVLRAMPHVREVKCSWDSLAGGDGVVRLEGIVAACAAAQEARRPLVLSVGGYGHMCVSEGGGAAPSHVSPEQAFERLQALWTQRLQTLPGPCTVQLLRDT
jgi:hypothetical protein